MTPSHLTVHEAFYSFQGEGVHMGQAAYFIRTQGCDQDCWFCDAAGTWHKNWKPNDLRRYEPVELALKVEHEAPEGAMIILTGGEPCLYDLDPLIRMLRAAGRYVAVETAGHRPLPQEADWITLSPKPLSTHPLPESVRAADEFKIIVSDIPSLHDGMACIPGRKTYSPVWLHPEWSHRDNADTRRLIVAAVKANAGRVRAGYQLHKLFAADLEDAQSRRMPIPLGGTGAAPW